MIKIKTLFLVITSFIAGIALTISLMAIRLPKIQPVDEQTLWYLINYWRQTENLQPLKKDDFLCQIAQKRFSEIIVNFKHPSPQSFLQLCPQCRGMGEILATGQTEYEILQSWLNSASHSAVLHDKGFTHSCIYTHGNTAIQIFAAY